MNRRRHRKLQRAVDAWVDGELTPYDAAAVRSHVEECWDCSSAAESLRLIKRALNTRRRADPPGIASVRLRRFAERLAHA